MTSENFSRGKAYLAQGTDPFFKQNADNSKSATANHVPLYCNARVMNIIMSQMFLFYFIFYGCYCGALVFLVGAETSASPTLAPPMFITIKNIIILHLFLGVATVGGTGTPWHTRGYAPAANT